ncbi:MAG: hypothetical protein Q4C96_03045 [Planctomycetia bacterium]|nr:hypothetical protein [Planctomycetia bacterium]
MKIIKNIYLHLFFLAILCLTENILCHSIYANETLKIPEIITQLSSQDTKQCENAHVSLVNLCMKAGTDTDLRNAINKSITDALAADATPAFTRTELLQLLRYTGTENEIQIVLTQLKNKEYTVCDEAIRTLAVMGEKGVAALKDYQNNADPRIKTSIQNTLTQFLQDPTIPVETDFPMSLPYADHSVLETWMKKYDTLSLEEKIGILTAITQIGDRKYTPYAVSAAKMQPESNNEMAVLLKRTGVLALEKLATKNEVSLIIDLALNYDHNLMINLASGIMSEGFDEALLNALGSTQDNRRKSVISEILARRNSGAALDKILSEAKSENCENRLVMFTNAVAVAGNNHINDLLDILVLFPPGAEREKAEKIIVGRCGGSSEAVRARIGDNPQPWFSLLGRIGDDAAWEIIKAGIQNKETQDAAVRGLCNFPHAKYAGSMREIFENTDNLFTDSQKIAALRAFIRVITLPTTDAPANEKLAALEFAMKKSTRDEERKLILSRISAIRDVKSAEFAYKYTKIDSLRESAYKALADLAHHNNLRRPNKEYFIPLLDEIIEKCQDPKVVERCKTYRSMMQ